MATVTVPGHTFTDVELLCLDLDRTLFDHESAAESGVKSLLAATPWASELPTQVSADPMRRWRALETLHYTRYERREIDHDEQRRERLRDFFTTADGSRRTIDPDQADPLFALYQASYQSHWRPFDDVAALVAQIESAGLATVVMTNGLTEIQQRKCDRIGLPSSFIVRANSDLVAAKPDPRSYQQVAELHGVEPAQVLMIGDSLDNDVLAPLAVGWQAIWLNRTGEPGASSGVATIASLHEVSVIE